MIPPLGGDTSLYLNLDGTVACFCWLMLLREGKWSSAQSSTKYLTVVNIPKKYTYGFIYLLILSGI